MTKQAFHVYRNTPLGREILMASGNFCRSIGAHLAVYIPRHPQFLMYFEDNIATVDLDRAFLRDPGTAEEHVKTILEPFGIEYYLYNPAHFTAKSLPEIATTFDYMTCPRSVGSLSTRISLGFIGPRIRSIVLNAPFPILIPPIVWKQWRRVVCFVGGSGYSLHALREAYAVAEASQTPLAIFTQGEKRERELYEKEMREAGLFAPVEEGRVEWRFFEKGEFRTNLFAVPHDALVIAGAYGRSLAKDLLFGSKLELLQTALPYPLMIVGPRCGAD